MTRPAATQQKITNRDSLLPIFEQYRREGKRVGYTSGVFDIVHRGHVEYLEAARTHCDVLVVGVNSDTSVKKNKGPSRPINPEAARARVIAGLACVEHVFLFSEDNNNANISLLKPDVYLKAGDYDRSRLTSAPLVEAYGGKVVVIPFSDGFSSTAIIERILGKEGVEIAGPPLSRRPAVFVDRDGTINEHVEYLHEEEKLRLFPGALEGLKRIRALGYYVIIVTNQPGIGLGYFTKEDLFRVNRRLLTEASKAGLEIDRIYFCPHSKGDHCTCRKPATGLIDRAAADLNIDLTGSFVIGDMTTDLELAHNAGCRAILVETGRSGKDGISSAVPDFTAADLPAVASLLETFPKPVIGQTATTVPGTKLEAVGVISQKIAHDFNNILGAIQACYEIVRQKAKSAPVLAGELERPLRIMSGSLDRGKSITSKLRGFVRPGPPSLENVPLRAVLGELQEVVQKATPSPFDLTINGNVDLAVSANQFQLMQILVGVCLNALDAMQDQSEKHLILDVSEVSGETSPGGGKRFARVSLIDHGTGIPDALQAHLFQPFVSTKGGVGKGFGVTLGMAREVLQKGGGDISLQTVPQCGTVVHLYLPLAG